MPAHTRLFRRVVSKAKKLLNGHARKNATRIIVPSPECLVSQSPNNVHQNAVYTPVEVPQERFSIAHAVVYATPELPHETSPIDQGCRVPKFGRSLDNSSIWIDQGIAESYRMKRDSSMLEVNAIEIVQYCFNNANLGLPNSMDEGLSDFELGRSDDFSQGSFKTDDDAPDTPGREVPEMRKYEASDTRDDRAFLTRDDQVSDTRNDKRSQTVLDSNDDDSEASDDWQPYHGRRALSTASAWAGGFKWRRDFSVDLANGNFFHPQASTISSQCHQSEAGGVALPLEEHEDTTKETYSSAHGSIHSVPNTSSLRSIRTSQQPSSAIEEAKISQCLSQEEEILTSQSKDVLERHKHELEAKYEQKFEAMQEVHRAHLINLASQSSMELEREKCKLEEKFQEKHQATNEKHREDLVNLASQNTMELQREITRLEAKHQEAYEAIEKTHHEDLMNRQEEQEAELDQLRDQNGELKRNFDALDVEVGLIRQEIKGLISSRTHTCEEYGTLAEGFNQVNSEKITLQQYAFDLKQHIRQIKSMYSGLENTHEGLKKQLSDMIAEKENDCPSPIHRDMTRLIRESGHVDDLETKATKIALELYSKEQLRNTELERELVSRETARLEEMTKMKVDLTTTECTLAQCQQEKKKISDAYHVLLGKISKKTVISAVTRGLADDLQYHLKEKTEAIVHAQEMKFRAEKAERRRVHQVQDLQSQLLTKTEALTKCQAELKFACVQIDSLDVGFILQQGVIEQTIPVLEAELDGIQHNIESGIISSAEADHMAFVTEMRDRLNTTRVENQFWERYLMEKLNQIQRMQIGWGFFEASTKEDLLNNHQFDLAAGKHGKKEALETQLPIDSDIVPEELKTTPLAGEQEEDEVAGASLKVCEKVVDPYEAPYEKFRVELLEAERKRIAVEKESEEIVEGGSVTF